MNRLKLTNQYSTEFEGVVYTTGEYKLPLEIRDENGEYNILYNGESIKIDENYISFTGVGINLIQSGEDLQRRVDKFAKENNLEVIFNIEDSQPDLTWLYDEISKLWFDRMPSERKIITQSPPTRAQLEMIDKLIKEKLKEYETKDSVKDLIKGRIE